MPRQTSRSLRFLRKSVDLEIAVKAVDSQIAGPYLWWRHEHRFEPAGEGTRVIDDVEYLPRASWLTQRFVQRDVERIFRFREDALRTIFGQRPQSTMDRRGSTASPSFRKIEYL